MKTQTAFRLPKELLKVMKKKADVEKRSLNNLVELTLTKVFIDSKKDTK